MKNLGFGSQWYVHMYMHPIFEEGAGPKIHQSYGRFEPASFWKMDAPEFLQLRNLWKTAETLV